MSHKSFQDLIKERLQNRGAPTGLVVTNKDDTKATIRIYDVIGWPFIEAQDVAAQLDGLEATEIEVQINSPGGDVFEAVAIYNALKSHPAKIITRVDGLAASGASVIAQAGDRRQMLTGTEMMIHEAWGFTMGFEVDHRKTADILNKLSNDIAGIYAGRSGGSAGDFFSLMQAETWLNPEEAIAAGLADEALDESSSINGSLVQHLVAAQKVVDEVSERVAEVAALRTDQGKSTDGSWRTREDVDRFAASLDRLTSALSPTDGPDPKSTEPPVDQERLARLRERASARAAEIAKAAEQLENLT